jgi:hypothetical protein
VKTEYEIFSSEAGDFLARSSVHLPLAWMAEFILRFAETGEFDTEALQDLAKEIRFRLDSLIKT